MSQKDDKIQLSEKDWDVLFKSIPITLGETVLEIKPIDLTQIFKVAASFRRLLNSGGFKDGDLFSMENLDAWRKATPELVSELIGLSQKDIARLPMGKFLEIVFAMLDTDADLIKNLLGLAEKLAFLAPLVKSAGLENLSLNSSEGDIDGRT